MAGGNNGIVEKELSYRIVGILFKIHKDLGRYSRERQYGDAFEKELKKEKISHKREMKIETAGRNSNSVDFCIKGRILVDLKAKPYITKDDYYQMQRYLQASGKELGLIVNFHKKSLRPKRVLNTRLHKENKEHTDNL